MPFDLSPYHLEARDTHQKVTKINAALDAVADAVNNQVPIDAVEALDIDWSSSDYHTKSISSSSTFTFSGIAASKAQGIMLRLTITGGAEPTFPASVKWPHDTAPYFDSGFTHLIMFSTEGDGVVRGAALENYTG